MKTKELLKLVEEHFGIGCAKICKERKRQVDVKGCPTINDAHNYYDNELTRAALCYVAPPKERNLLNEDDDSLVSWYWPFDDEWWKPTPDNRSRELEKAGALIAADLDRSDFVEKDGTF